MGFISPVATDAQGNVRTTGSLQQLGKDDFLQLMITKLQHQDPMDPMDDEDFIAQLAQFSSLEQLYNIADGLTSSNEWDYLQMQSINNVMASGFIGKDVKAEYSGIYVEASGDAKISYTMDTPASEVTFTIKDAEGNSITSFTQDNVEAGINTVAWDGTDKNGNRVDEGYYYVEATGLTGSGEEVAPRLSMEGTVEAIIYRDGAAYLRVNGMDIPMSDITTIAQAGSYSADTEESDE